jgi:hypothetical protein
MQQQVETSLQLRDVLMANTARYGVTPDKFIFTPAPNALHLIWTIYQKKLLAIDGQCGPNRWPVTDAKKGLQSSVEVTYD